MAISSVTRGAILEFPIYLFPTGNVSTRAIQFWYAVNFSGWAMSARHGDIHNLGPKFHVSIYLGLVRGNKDSNTLYSITSSTNRGSGSCLGDFKYELGEDRQFGSAPCIGYGTTEWDEKGHSAISHIFISHITLGVDSIQFRYNVGTVEPTMGQNSVANSTYICSITFGTNRAQYGPFGIKSRRSIFETFFKFDLGGDGQFGGFHGTADTRYLNSIGFYLKLRMT
ncbi:Protein RESTRICTED TEV MOVEMENT 1 [Striga hermonthica]|uniref:Protein RESTRICTED TEV MOVEMENT 1 n=1 Tax=Striga hermonthica TaxID=68872 RepID=A0A9N7RKR3_STRHE|nr:Protein RESTRICTED TEV MOVEMENT 1 [Striga hermonthica]